jgi:MoxR-like ATPase
MSRNTVNKEQLLSDLQSLYGSELTAADIRGFCASRSMNYQTVTRYLEPYKTQRGRWNLEITQEVVEEIERNFNAPAVMPAFEQNLIPEKDDTFVKFGNFGDIKKIIQSRLFYPTFITGLSGNGKTFSVEQACAQLGRELIRVNITVETDEDDLIGGFRLVNGETVWHNGPVIEALQRGAILLLDEIDLASNKILCLQSILEGKGVFLKKIGQFVKPSAGFNVIATANTKGKGSDDGRFVGTNVLNSAFLDRFAITFEQEYPSSAVEVRILNTYAKAINLENSEEFIKKLCDWGDVIRKTFYDGGVDEIVSTRRLVTILKAYTIFDSKEKAIRYSISGFDEETKTAFLELYDKIDADFVIPSSQKPELTIEGGKEVPF